MRYKIIIIWIALVVLAVLAIMYFNRATPITNSPSKGTDIIAFGDSLIVGVGATGGNDFVSLLSKKIGEPIINMGNSGDTTADGIERLSELDAYNPKVVILLLGGNDHLKKIPATDTQKNLAVLIENIQSRGAVVLLLGVRGGLFRDNFNDMFDELRDVYHTAFVSDVLGGLFGKPEFMSDTIHPNDAGYRIIADRIFLVLDGLLD